ncbi:MAG TPA: hypothetical protein VGN81_15735, partial [Pseudonocardiaceae bacterium]
VKLFLAAMWSDRMRRPLRRLLKRRHRTTNLGFVVMLTRFGPELPFNIHSMAVRTLQSLIHDKSPGMGDWQQYVGWLSELDKPQAIATLCAVLDDARDPVPETRLFEAMRQLAELDRTDALVRTAAFVSDQTKTGEARMRMARLAASVDVDQGMAAFATLAERPEIGRLRLEAALWVAEHSLARGADLLATIRDDHDTEDSLRISAALAQARCEPGGGIAGLISLGQGGSLQWATRVQFMRAVIPVDRTAAAQIYSELVRDRGAPVAKRIRVLRELAAEFELSWWFAEVANDATEEPPLRMSAAWVLASYNAEGSRLALRAIGADSLARDLDRATAAQLIDLLSRPTIAPVALDGIGVQEVDRLEVASAVRHIAGSSVAVPLLVALAEDPDEPSSSRTAAATTILKLDDAVALSVHSNLALDPTITGGRRFEIAQTVAKRYGKAQAQPLFRALAEADVAFDVRMRAIGKLAFHERPDRYVELSNKLDESGKNRLAAAQAAAKDDGLKGTKALVDFVEAWPGFSLRMEATGTIPDRDEKVRLYSKLAATHRYADDDRLTAAKAAAALNRTGALRKLAGEPGVSRQIRKAAQDQLDKIDNPPK